MIKRLDSNHPSFGSEDCVELTVNVGVIGLGKMGILHSGILNSLPDARVGALCDKDSLLISAAKAVLPQTIAFYKDHNRMLENERLDAVFVTTPISTHVPIVVDLVRANKEVNLFVEKPLAASSEQARTACEAVKSLRGVHMVGFQRRFSPIFQKAKELIEAKAIGDLIFFRAYCFSSDVLRVGHSWRLRSGAGGVLLDLAPHVLDLLLWFFGEPVVRAAVRRRAYSTEVDDYVHAMLSFQAGLEGHMDVCWSTCGFRLPEMSIEVYGRNGVLTVSDDFVKVRVEKGGSYGIGKSETYYKQSFDSSVPFLLADPEFTKEDTTFLSAIHHQRMPDLNFFEAARVNAIVDLIGNMSAN